MRALGVAVFVQGKLRHAILVKNPEAKARGPIAWARMADAVQSELHHRGITSTQTLVVEQQVVQYGRTRNPADIIELTGVTGALVGRLPAVEYVGYFPNAWKGSTAADAFTARIEARLTDSDKLAIEPCAESLRHNVLDSIGLGKFHLAGGRK